MEVTEAREQSTADAMVIAVAGRIEYPTDVFHERLMALIRSAIASRRNIVLDEEPWRDAHDYVILDAQGNIVQRFDVMVWSLEDDLRCSVFAVIGGGLRNLRVVCSDGEEVDWVETTIVYGLQPVADDDDATRRFLSAAMARHRELFA